MKVVSKMSRVHIVLTRARQRGEDVSHLGIKNVK